MCCDGIASQRVIQRDWIVMGNLEGKVALVAGATRGAGRGIAVELGAAGAIVTARSLMPGGTSLRFSMPANPRT